MVNFGLSRLVPANGVERPDRSSGNDPALGITELNHKTLVFLSATALAHRAEASISTAVILATSVLLGCSEHGNIPT
jgi:hypothetical protein